MSGSIQLLQKLVTQPRYHAPISESRLSKKLLFALIGGQFYELVNNVAATGTLGNSVATPGGMAYVLPSTNTTWTRRIDALDPYVSGSFSVFWRGVIRADTLQTLLSYSGSGVGWELKSDGWAPGQIRVRLDRVFYGAGPAIGPVGVGDGLIHSVMLTYDDPAASIEIFLDGASVGSAGYTKDPGAVGNGSFSVKGDATSPHQMLTVQAFAGKLSATEIRSLQNQPWQVFGAPPRRLYIVTGGTGTINLVGAASTQAGTSDTGAISQTHILVGANSLQAENSGTGAITQAHALIGSNSTQANTGSSPAITQTHILVSTNSTQANASSTGSIAGGANLTIAPSTQGNSSSTGVITQTHALVMAPSVQDNIAAASAIVQAHILAGSNSTQGNLGGTGAISLSTGNLIGASSNQINLGGTSVISMIGIVPDAFLDSMVVSTAIKKPGVPTGTPEWLKTIIEIILGRRGNKIAVPAQQNLTFSSTPTQAECQALYSYVNQVRDSLDSLVNRLDS